MWFGETSHATKRCDNPGLKTSQFPRFAGCWTSDLHENNVFQMPLAHSVSTSRFTGDVLTEVQTAFKASACLRNKTCAHRRGNVFIHYSNPTLPLSFIRHVYKKDVLCTKLLLSRWTYEPKSFLSALSYFPWGQMCWGQSVPSDWLIHLLSPCSDWLMHFSTTTSVPWHQAINLYRERFERVIWLA